MCNQLVFYKELGIDTETKQFRRYYNAGLLENIDEEYVKEVKSYWLNNYGKNIDPVLHVAFNNLTGQKNVKVIPGKEMWSEVIPFFNDLNMSDGYSDKNMYDNLITSESTAETVLKCVYGNYFDRNNNDLNEREALKVIKDNNEMIIKPSNTNNGIGISKMKVRSGELFINGNKVTLNELMYKYNFNFIVQKIIQQHEIMSAPHPHSVNTLRMVTLRWKGEIKYLLTFSRFGANEDVKDNAGTGGVCLGVNENGEFKSVAMDANCKTYTHHPTTNFPFSDMGKIPNFGRFIDFVKKLHRNILHHNFVSWDIAVGEHGEPIFIEANYRGAVWLYQLSTATPIFGELTTEIINEIKHAKKDPDISKKQIVKTRKLKRDYRRLKNENKKLTISINKVNKVNKELKTINNKYETETKQYRKELKDIRSSRSWKVTKPIRSIGRLLK
jgi:hypothetical protein